MTGLAKVYGKGSCGGRQVVAKTKENGGGRGCIGEECGDTIMGIHVYFSTLVDVPFF